MNALTLAKAKIKSSNTNSSYKAKNFHRKFWSKSRIEVKERKKKLKDLWSLFDAVQSHIEILENVDPANIDKDVLKMWTTIATLSKFREFLFSVNIVLQNDNWAV